MVLVRLIPIMRSGGIVIYGSNLIRILSFGSRLSLTLGGVRGYACISDNAMLVEESNCFGTERAPQMHLDTIIQAEAEQAGNYRWRQYGQTADMSKRIMPLMLW